jgi:aspartate/methionine/tyrosine aminotransferase
MKYPSLYLNWYVHVPKVKYDFRSSGLGSLKFNLTLGEVDLSLNYEKGNPETVKLLAQRYQVRPENIFVSSEGTSGQNARVIRVLAEKNRGKSEAIVEYPTYEPLLRQVQEHFRSVKRLERDEKEAYGLHADGLRKIVSEKTGLLALTNPHLPSGAASDVSELKEIMSVASEYGFYVLCDEIYAEFNRDVIPTIFSIDSERGIVTTSFSKAYGLGGLKMGVALAREDLVDELYSDALSTVGTFSNVVELVTSKLLTDGISALESNRKKWVRLRKEAEKLLNERGFEYLSNNVSITFWVKLPLKDTHKWVNEHTIPRYDWAAVPGAFFLFKNDYKLVKSDRIRLGVGNINPNNPNLTEAFDVLGKALDTYQ